MYGIEIPLQILYSLKTQFMVLENSLNTPELLYTKSSTNPVIWDRVFCDHYFEHDWKSKPTGGSQQIQTEKKVWSWSGISVGLDVKKNL